jgi:hypothetical protein
MEDMREGASHERRHKQNKTEARYNSSWVRVISHVNVEVVFSCSKSDVATPPLEVELGEIRYTLSFQLIYPNPNPNPSPNLTLFPAHQAIL